MKGTFTFILLLILAAVKTQAQQNVGIGTSTPDASAILHLNSTSKGFLVPKLTVAKKTPWLHQPQVLLFF